MNAERLPTSVSLWERTPLRRDDNRDGVHSGTSATTRLEALTMPKLRIDLQDGFMNDTVEIWLNNQRVARYEGVSTDLRISLAQSHELELPQGDYHAEIRLPVRAMSAGMDLPLYQDLYLGVSVNGNRIILRLQTENFIYM
jgi:hypothetical protein